MTFLEPWYLVGLVGAALPVVLHLLARRRTRTVDFSSLVFLTAIERSAIRKARLHQRVLLAVRIALLWLTALGLASPSCHGPPPLTVITLDGSASMTAGGGAVWREAKDPASRLLDEATGPVEVALATDRLRLGRPGRAKDALEAFVPRGVALDMEAVLADASDASAHLRRPLRLVLISDFQPSGWPDTLAILPSVELWGLPLDGARGNVWVGSLTALGPVRAGGVIDVVGTVERSGETPDTCVLHARIGGRTFRSVARFSGHAATFSLRVPREEPLVRATVTVEDPEGLVLDDRREFAFSSPPRCRVAIVGPPGETARRLAAALDPEGDGLHGFEVRRELAEAVLDSLEAIILVEATTPDRWALAVEERWARGTGLVLVADGTTLSEAGSSLFRRVLGAAPVAPRAFHATGASVAFDHPILAPFAYAPPPGLSLPDIARVWILDGAVPVVLSAGGSPLIVEGPRATPRTVAFMTGLVPPWSDWSSRSSFVPLIHLVTDHVAGSLTAQAVTFGTAVSVELPPERTELEYPDGARAPLVPDEVSAGVARFRVGPFLDPGVHVLWQGGTPRALFEPVVPPQERLVGPPIRPRAVSRWVEPSTFPWPNRIAEPASLLLWCAWGLLWAEAWLALSLTPRHRGGAQDRERT